jgi:hypothetical protein
MKQSGKFGALILAAAVLCVAQGAVPTDTASAFELPHRFIDGHGHVLLPEGYWPYFYGGHPYYFYAGVWYAPGPGGFVVVRPPVGVVLSVLPTEYSTVW